jgi:FdhD protein
VPRLTITGAATSDVRRTVDEETPVASICDGSTHAVMIATRQDLEDFALGFNLAEVKIV